MPHASWNVHKKSQHNVSRRLEIGLSRTHVNLPCVHLTVVDQTIDARQYEHFVAPFLWLLGVVLSQARLPFERYYLFINGQSLSWYNAAYFSGDGVNKWADLVQLAGKERLALMCNIHLRGITSAIFGNLKPRLQYIRARGILTMLIRNMMPINFSRVAMSRPRGLFGLTCVAYKFDCSTMFFFNSSCCCWQCTKIAKLDTPRSSAPSNGTFHAHPTPRITQCFVAIGWLGRLIRWYDACL